MRTKTVNIYKFSELSEKAKQRVKDEFAANDGYVLSDEAMASINALAEAFGGKMCDYQIDWFGGSYSSAKFKMPCDWSKADIRKKLMELGTYNKRTLKGHGECKLTGYCMDENAIDGFRIAFVRKKVTDLEELMDAAFDSWLKAAQADCEDYYSDEQFSEMCNANEYEFYEDGRIAR